MYFITVFIEKPGSDKLITNRRTWGYFVDKEMAYEALHDNSMDMHETIYNYAVVEKFSEGICPYHEERQFFAWDEEKKGFFEISEPEFAKHRCNFGLG